MDFMLSVGFIGAFGMFGALVYYVMEVGGKLKEISNHLSEIAKHLEQIAEKDEA